MPEKASLFTRFIAKIDPRRRGLTPPAAQSIRGNMIAIGVARIGAILLDSLVYVLTARYFGPEDYGHYLAVLAFLTLVDVAADMSVMDIAVREMSQHPDESGGWLGALTFLRTGLGALGMAAFTAYSLFRGLNQAHQSTLWLGLLILAAGSLRTPLAIFRAQMRMNYELAIILATRLFNLLLFMWLISLHSPVHHFFAAVLGSRALLAVLSWECVRRKFPVRLSIQKQQVLLLAKESLPMALSGLFVAIQLKADILILAQHAGKELAGLYGAVAQLPEYSLYLPVIISTPLLPVMSRAFRNSDVQEFTKFYQQMFDAILALGIPAAVLTAVMPAAVVKLLFGDGYVAASAYVPVLLLATMAMWASHAMAIAAVAGGLQRHFIWIQSVCVVLYVGLNWILIPGLGPMAAAYVRLLTAALAPVLTYIVVRRYVGAGLGFAGLGRTLLAGAGMAAALVMVEASSALPLIPAAMIGVAFYALAMWAMRQTREATA